MPVDIDSPEGHIIRKMIPFSTMPNNIFKVICGKIVIENARSGTFLFKRGDTKNDLFYLLKGEVSLEVAPLKMEIIKAGTESSRFAIAHQLPRKVNAVAKGAVRFLRLNTIFINPPDPKELEKKAEPEKKEAAEIVEAKQEDNQDSISTLLMIPIVRSLPPANIPQINEGLEEVRIEKDKFIIKQGEFGDFYYLIKSGECLVSRKNSKHSKSIKIAKLQVWDTFGEEALISGEPRGETVSALTDMVLLRLHKDKFLKLIKEPSLDYIYFIETELLLDEGAVLLDVRPPDEYERIHLPEAINTPLFSLRMELKSLDKNKVYLLICNNGKVSESAAFLLKSYNFTVKIIRDGMRKVPQETLVEAQKLSEGSSSHDDVVFNKARSINVEAIPSMANTNDALSEENKLLSKNLKELKIRLARVENEKKELEEKYKSLFKQAERFKSMLDTLTKN
ncbi:MAG: cyclic nucleotide-binding domain-containing protein [Methylococcaceae bacterium]|nr:cyclic nucleotide-binding domain-containing protein [Methylococcaceae bacterium]